MIVVATTSANATCTISIGNLETLFGQILSSSTPSASLALSIIQGNTSWPFYSSCCNHMTSYSHLCSKLIPNTTAPSIHTTDIQMQVNQHGQISTSTLSLPNTFLIPNISFRA